jgi:hypothetical protein
MVECKGRNPHRTLSQERAVRVGGCGGLGVCWLGHYYVSLTRRTLRTSFPTLAFLVGGDETQLISSTDAQTSSLTV